MAEQRVPPVEVLTSRLARCPQDFAGAVDVGAILADVLADLGHQPLPSDWLKALAPGAQKRRGRKPDEAARLRTCVAIVTWLLAEYEIGRLLPTDKLVAFMAGPLRVLSGHVRPGLLVDDADRREELARLVFLAAGVTPAGETEAQAQDRLATLDTTGRASVVAAAKAAEEHARKVREALARKRAEEAAARAMRE